MGLEHILFLMGGAALVACIAYVARNEIRLMRDLSARMTARGLASGARSPKLQPADHRFDARVGWRGKIAGHDVDVFIGRAFGPRLSARAAPGSLGDFFYVWALLPSAPDGDDWISRWKDDARAVRQEDGRTLVYWQRDYTVANVDEALDALEASLR